MIILGIVLLIVGFIAAVHIIWILGIIALVVGGALAIAGATGRAIGGRSPSFSPRARASARRAPSFAARRRHRSGVGMLIGVAQRRVVVLMRRERQRRGIAVLVLGADIVSLVGLRAWLVLVDFVVARGHAGGA